MRVLIASDIHGSAKWAGEILGRAKIERAERIVLLGDVYNHGPRNPFPEDYNPMAVAEMLNKLENLTVIRGNCDSEVDEMISDFPLIESAVILSDGVDAFLTHGHVYNKDNLPKGYGCVLYGHFHTAFIEKIGDTVVANPGSVALPKDGFRGYLFLNGNELSLKDLDGEVKISTKL